MSVWYDWKENYLYIIHEQKWRRDVVFEIMQTDYPTYVYIGEFD